MSESYARLEPFLLMARSTKGAAAAKIVLDATAAVSWRGCTTYHTEIALLTMIYAW